ncbi:MAG: ABC transporter permease [Candidatus Microsaccharimonas sp.]
MRYLSVKNRSILREMVSTSFKVRYQGSVLGYFWAILKPLFVFAVLYVLFVYIAPIGKDVPHFGISLLLGIVFWNFFSETTMIGTTSIVANGDLIRKISIPRYLVVVASSVSALINLCLSMIVVVIFAIFNGVFPSVWWLLIPLVIFELYIFALGIAFGLSALYVKFRDITYIWEVLLQAGFYASMVLIPIQVVPEYLRQWFFFNPIVQILQDARALLISTADNITIWNTAQSLIMGAVPFILIILVCAFGFYYFKSRSKYFAEDV